MKAKIRFLSSRFVFTVNGADSTISASDPQPVRVAAGVPHTFAADPTYDGPCTVEIRSYVGPNASGANDEDEGVNVKLCVALCPVLFSSSHFVSLA